MGLPQILSLIGTIPLFSMRTFFPAFLTALFFTHPELFPGIGDVSQVEETGTFLAQNWLLITLGILSVLEFISDKNSDIKVFLREAEPYIKPISYLAIQFFVLSDSSIEALDQINYAGFNPWIILAVAGSGGVYYLAKIRKKFLEFLMNIDEDDDLFIGKIISWVEDSLVLFGFILLVWAGVFMIILYGIIIGILLLIRKQNEKRLENQKVECPNCKAKIHAFAPACHICNFEQEKVNEIGVLGQKKQNFVSDIFKHKLNLLGQRRCSNCASKLEYSKLPQTCEACNTQVFEDPTEVDFVQNMDKKFYRILFLSVFIGFIPIIGFVVSASLTGIHLLSPYRRYISKGGGFFSKILIRLITIVLFICGVGFGFIAAPVYATIRYYVIRSQFKIATKQKLIDISFQKQLKD